MKREVTVESVFSVLALVLVGVICLWGLITITPLFYYLSWD